LHDIVDERAVSRHPERNAFDHALVALDQHRKAIAVAAKSRLECFVVGHLICK
jgi:hypothetical protein